MGVKVRAAFEALTYLIALGVAEHEAAGQRVTRVTVSGGMAKSDLLVETLATVLNRDVIRLRSSEGTALGAAVVAAAGYECWRQKATSPDEVATATTAATERLVKFHPSAVRPNGAWSSALAEGFRSFREQLHGVRGGNG